MASSDSEEKQLVSNAEQKQIVDNQDVFKIERPISNQLNKRRPSITEMDEKDRKRTSCNLDYLPPDFKNAMIDGRYDKKINLNEGRGYVCDCRKQKGNCISWFFLCSMFICIILIMIGRVNFVDDRGYWLLLFPIGVLWILYSFEWRFISHIYDYLAIAQNDMDVKEYLNKLHEIKPVRIIWQSQSFHYDTDTSKSKRNVTKIVTDEVERIYTFETEDISMDVEFSKYELTKLNLFKTWTFADETIKLEYDNEFKAFCKESKTDEYQKVCISMELKNYKRRILVNSAKGERVKYWSIQFYYLFSCFCCSPCYRAVFNGNSGVKTHIIHKKVSLPMKEVSLKTKGLRTNDKLIDL